MTCKQNIEIAIFCAEQVIHIYEASYPDDNRPRAAIEAAKAVLANDTEENRKAARSAADAADAAHYDYDVYYSTKAARSAAYDAHAAHYAARSAAYAAAAAAHYDYDVYYSTKAARSAAYAAEATYVDAAYAAAYTDVSVQETIIREAVAILDRGEK
jgi:hypothetical protein